MINVLKFGAEWCCQCKPLDATLDKLKATHKDVTLEIIDVSDNPEDNPLVSKYNVTSLPTIIIINSDTKKVEKLTGNAPLYLIEEAIIKTK